MKTTFIRILLICQLACLASCANLANIQAVDSSCETQEAKDQQQCLPGPSKSDPDTID